MGSIYLEYQKRLIELAETQYQAFLQKLIPNSNNILGVRSPAIKKLAKELSKDNWREYFELSKDVYYEETLLQGAVIGLLKEDIETVLDEARRYIPKISNWALCDSFCSGLKITKPHKERVWEFVVDYVNSNEPYEIRFAVVMMLFYYIDDEYTTEILGLIEQISIDDYYVKMAAAWAVSMCYVNQPAITMPFLNNNKLDDFTYNKALSKICESLKPSAEEKALIKNMKRRTTK